MGGSKPLDRACLLRRVHYPFTSYPSLETVAASEFTPENQWLGWMKIPQGFDGLFSGANLLLVTGIWYIK